MNKSFGLLLFILIQSFHLYSQFSRGQIIYKDNVVNISFQSFPNINNMLRFQQKVIYLDTLFNECILKPDEAIEVRIINQNKEEISRLVSVKNTLGLGSPFYNNTHIFLQLVIDGDLRLYKYLYRDKPLNFLRNTISASSGITLYINGSYQTIQYGPYGGGNNNYSARNYELKYVLHKKGQSMEYLYRINLKAKDIQYFSNCPKLQSYIKENNLTADNIIQIVYFYNDNCY